jgi:hypothetical protein
MLKNLYELQKEGLINIRDSGQVVFCGRCKVFNLDGNYLILRSRRSNSNNWHDWL